MKTLLALMILTVSFGSVAHAGPKRVERVNFDESDVDGKVRQPDGSYIVQKKGIDFIPLYKLKENFDEQIEESLEYMK